MRRAHFSEQILYEARENIVIDEYVVAGVQWNNNIKLYW